MCTRSVKYSKKKTNIFKKDLIMKCVLHITHTNIENDSRILKEMSSLEFAGYKITGLGVFHDEASKRSEIPLRANLYNIRLASRKLVFLPKIARHTISVFELIVKTLPRAVFSKPDIVHCHDTLVLPLGVLVAFITRSKLIYDAHELESDRNGLSFLQSKLTLIAERFLWPYIDGLIVVSPSIRKWYHDNIGFKYSEIILNSPTLDAKDTIVSNYLREKFKVPQSCKIFVYVGILNKGRGLDFIEHAFQDIRISSHVVFLGYGEMVNQIKSLSNKYPNFHYHEAVQHSEVVPIISSADFGLCLVECVSLSDYYCLPNKLFEYCFAGIPVLASDFPDISRMVSKYSLGKCCDLNIQSIVNAILEIEKSDSELFMHNDLHEISWSAQSSRLVQFYSRLLSF